GMAVLTPRRTAPFAPEPGAAVHFTLTENGMLVAEHLLFADANGLVRTPLVPLALARRHARFELLGPAGTATVPESASSSTPEGATLLALGAYGVGDLTVPGDLDHWRVTLTAGEEIELEVLAARFDPAAWQTAGAPPLVRILGPDGAGGF